MTTTQQLATFYLDRLLFGIEVEKVQEVLRYQEMTRVPLASRAVEGLINLRGQIVTAIDLRQRLELGVREPGALPMNVVVVDDATFEQPPETVRGVARELIRGVHKLRDELLLVLDTERAVDLDGAETRDAN
jgi:purine-binding chemotaxis protein CheW